MKVAVDIAEFNSEISGFPNTEFDKALANWLVLLNYVYLGKPDFIIPEIKARKHIVIEVKQKRHKPLTDDDKNFIENEKTTQQSEVT